MVDAPAVVVVVVRAYDDARDRVGVEEVERACEVGSMSGGGGKMCLFTDLLGDPLCRIRHSPDSLMLVRILATRTTPLVLLPLSLSLSVCSVYTPTLWSWLPVRAAGRLRLSTV